jgi:hypothetical protein
MEMNPPTPLDSSPPGEIELFERLAASKGTEHWVAFQGLLLADHTTQVMGEIDFLVFVPNVGILVIEVKSHRRMSRDAAGRWILGSSGPTNRSPFKQAADQRFSLLDWMKRRGVGVQGFPIWHAVWTTSLNRVQIPRSPEWHDWELLDSTDLRIDPVAAIKRCLAAATKHLTSTSSFRKIAGAPTPRDIVQLAGALRADFEVVQSVSEAARTRAKELERYLPEQLRVLNYFQYAQQIVVEGSAGTGKTYVAVEAAARAAEAGRRTLLVVYNRLLANFLGDQARLAGLSVDVTTIHSLMRRIAAVDVPANAGNEWWTQVLPELAVTELLSRTSPAEYDYLVVDEAQDVMVAEYAGVLDLLLREGLKRGKSLIAGDFAHQAIFAGIQDPKAIVETLQPAAWHTELEVNCRNTRSIGTHANLLAHLDPGYDEFRRPDPGVAPWLDFVDHDEDFERRLSAHVRTYVDERYGLEEIVVLTPHHSSSASRTRSKWLRDRITFDGLAVNKVRVLTIQEFKGLEAPVVIVSDINDAEAPQLDALFYVAITRATSRLSVIARRSVMVTKVGKGNS